MKLNILRSLILVEFTMHFPRLILVLLVFGLYSCAEKEKEYRTYQGEIFGTYYRIQVNELERDFQPAFDSVFSLINQASNSYIQESEVSDFNNSGSIQNPSFTFRNMLDSCRKYHRLSEGFFEPTLFPLIKAWGFSFEEKEKMDSSKVIELMPLIGFESKIMASDSGFFAAQEGVKLDITGLGEGYALDKLAEVLNAAGVSDYMVEIGGEMKAKGKNSRGAIWSIGIEDPQQVELGNTNVLLAKVELDNKAISSSGNYRKFYLDENGIRRPHILNPLTGFPVSHSMVSVSVLANSATEADALATAFMSMGPEKARVLAESIPGVEAMFIIGGKDKLEIEYTSGFPKPEEKK
ncbi:thiamine biosynthesis lipoprotein [Algoriphagus boseongensis]|uniref:FAD:protein FMN transferase n=1 Tax=Algoriphagus boseongensis TaxID=1442587 RepID=A0A4R6T943_9BACT|nr:FAD:protein FMN transferase [Algoriphagus boseongensis]TDQ19266.1 thiamine biosynthesis lipoprotein [Algoriphagus boseongensis]